VVPEVVAIVEEAMEVLILEEELAIVEEVGIMEVVIVEEEEATEVAIVEEEDMEIMVTTLVAIIMVLMVVVITPKEVKVVVVITPKEVKVVVVITPKELKVVVVPPLKVNGFNFSFPSSRSLISFFKSERLILIPFAWMRNFSHSLVCGLNLF